MTFEDWIGDRDIANISAYEGWCNGAIVAMRNVMRRLAAAIEDAEQRHEHVCKTRGIMDQESALQSINDMKAAFAYATNTAVGGAEFNLLLKMSRESNHETH